MGRPIPPVLAAAMAECAARQPSAPIEAQPDVPPEVHAETIRRSYRMGAAVLAWCMDHPFAVGRYQHLAEELRQAMARRELIQPILSEIWCSVPGAAAVRALPALASAS